ncbi:U32 family peptidase [Thermoanaerobacterium thermosaccharolyticum]|uniref:peptidase U32 family protein n=1 Tax=Thermoanaerobacterium TaxID=28895 RepID=UPI0026DF57FE|nr:U32 family peptidase [Thermoanaerobacterium sp. CMT5567-10]MDK2804846.1 family peptidase [Thermoanaerobacterium sp.]WHE08001.1 U32 family peptidase [Thermoanaerobacterium thermosaccharolyticum]WKV08959.1 U32 family peptidase [Thermoanaerobacterium sp. CMT5567-10]
MVELLSPAGDIERVKIAINYGADAVYFGGSNYGLRATVGFNMDEIKYAVEYVKKHGKKAYLTVNIFPHNEDLVGLPEYIYEVSKTGIDAVIVSDPGVFSVIRDVAPKLEIHISTQANNVNYRSAIFWHNLGAKRIVLARELSLEEIKEIREKTPNDLELEVFVHGAMCISYSGRCLLSNYLTGRDANKGECTHPCRWKYYIVEEKRPGQYMSIEEDDRGTYIMNSKDLCMIKYIPDIIKAGVTSLKIEGRNKSSYYVAVVTKAYRKAIDDFLKFGDKYVFDEELLEELGKVSNRDFTTGFYFGKPGAESQNYNSSSYIRNYNIVGMVLDYDEENGIAIVEQRNRFFLGDEVEIIGPHDMFTEVINRMYDADGNEIEVAPHPQMIVKIPFERKVGKYYMLRKKA